MLKLLQHVHEVGIVIIGLEPRHMKDKISTYQTSASQILWDIDLIAVNISRLVGLLVFTRPATHSLRCKLIQRPAYSASKSMCVHASTVM